MLENQQRAVWDASSSSLQKRGGVEDHHTGSAVVLKTSTIGYTKAVIFRRQVHSKDAQHLARFCSILPICYRNLITDPPNFAANSLI